MARLEPHPFRSTIPYYERYRIPYPDALIADVVERCGIRPGSAVLDLGCGPGQLAVAFARRGARVTAMDPDPAMLSVARLRAADARVAIRLIEGGSFDLGPAIGRFHLVAMGRSFHWMDRDATLAKLDGMIEPGGAVALISDAPLDAPGPDWRGLVRRLGKEFAPEREAERRDRMKPGERRAALMRSAFSRLETRGIRVRRDLTADDIVGLVYTYSVTTPAALGDQRVAFETALREGLAALSADGVFAEIVEVTAVIARRPS